MLTADWVTGGSDVSRAALDGAGVETATCETSLVEPLVPSSKFGAVKSFGGPDGEVAAVTAVVGETVVGD